MPHRCRVIVEGQSGAIASVIVVGGRAVPRAGVPMAAGRDAPVCASVITVRGRAVPRANVPMAVRGTKSARTKVRSPFLGAGLAHCGDSFGKAISTVAMLSVFPGRIGLTGRMVHVQRGHQVLPMRRCWHIARCHGPT